MIGLAQGASGEQSPMPGADRPARARVLARVATAAAVVVAVWALSDVTLVLFIAVLLACVLRGMTDFLVARTGVRTGFALAAVVIILLLAAAGMTWWMVPHLVREGPDLVGRLSQEWQRLRPWLGLPAGGGDNGPLPILGAVRGRVASSVETVLGSSLHTALGLVVIVVTAIYLAAAPELYLRGALHLVPFPMRPRVREVLVHIAQVLRLWMLGQFLSMVAVGVLAGAGMLILHVPAPFALGVLTGVLTFVPYFGAILAAAPALLLAFTVSWQTAAWALGVYTLCHCVEGYLIAPIAQRRLIELPPALTVISMTVSGTLFGLLGIAVGTPLAAAGLTAVRMLYVEDVLHDDTVGGGDVMGGSIKHNPAA